MNVVQHDINSLQRVQNTFPIPLVIANYPALFQIKWNPFLAAKMKFSPVNAIWMKAFLFRKDTKRSKQAE